MTIKCPGCKTGIVVPEAEGVEEEAAQPLAAAPPASEAPTNEQLWGADDPDEDDEDEGLTLSHGGPEVEEMDLTPMVDVTFLLLIFFMITASFTVQKVIATTTPDPNEEGASQQIQQKDTEKYSILVEIDENDQIHVEGDPLSGIGDLHGALAQHMGAETKNEITIKFHYLASHKIIVEVRDAAREAGITRIRREIQPGTKPGG